MELESSNLIIIKAPFNYNNFFSFDKDIKQFFNFLTSLLRIINVFLVFFLIIIFIFYKTILFIGTVGFQFMKDGIKNLESYQNIQNNFCDDIRNLKNKKLEDKIYLVNASLNEIKFDIFIYNNLSINNYYENEKISNILNALQNYSYKNDYEEDDILIITIAANAGWYTTAFGIFNYSILSFEPFIDNYYISKKNYCRNIKNFIKVESTITIINRTIYPIEKICNYYKDINNIKKDQILCNIKNEKNLDKDYIKIGTIQTMKLDDIIPLLNKRITLLVFDLELEGEMALESGKDLITKYHIPFIFIEFNILTFRVHETDAKKFLLFFIQNGYKISLDGFLTSQFIRIDDLLRMNFLIIDLYIIYVGN